MTWSELNHLRYWYYKMPLPVKEYEVINVGVKEVKYS